MSAKSEHLVVVPFEPLKYGDTFTDWPLHTTIVPWFPVKEGHERELDGLLTEISKRHKPIVVKVGEIAMFGSKKDVPVSIILPNRELTELHLDVFSTLEDNGFPIHQKDISGENYQAHISHQGEKRYYDGTEIEISKFALIRQTRQKAVGTMVKRLVREYPLRGENKTG